MADVLETLKKLPKECYVKTPMGQVVKVVRGIMGHFPITSSYGKMIDLDKVNAGMGCNKAQAEAMLAGSMFGWEVPAADPDMYDSEGHIIPEKVQEIARKGGAKI